MDIIMMRHNLIDMIMQTTDSEELAAVYDLMTKRKKKTKKVKSLENVEPVATKPRKEIPVAEIRKGVTLEEIKASQKTSPKDYDRIVEMFEDEEWDQSLEELLKTLD